MINQQLSKIKMGIVFFICLMPFSYSNAQIVIIGEMTHEKQMLPNETHQGTVTIHNKGKEIKNVRIYQTDYFFVADGTSQYGEPGSLERSNAEWIIFTPKQATVPPHEDLIVNYSVKVPDDSTLIGTYWSMLMVEEIPEIKPDKPDGNVAIRVVMRYGIQLVTNIGETGIRQLVFSDPRLIKKEEIRNFQINIKNIGERWLRPNVWIELYSHEGESLGTFKGDDKRTYPETSIRITIDLSEVKVGIYKALVVADCGGDDLFGASYNLEIGE